MKTTIVVTLLVLSVLMNVLLWRRVSALETAAAATDFPLGENMGYMQRYADKVWYAAQAGNWDLAQYYHDELAETMEGIVAAHIVKDGINVSGEMNSILPPALQALNDTIAARDAAGFRERYDGVVGACNTCHGNAKHPFIHITLPSGPPTAWNQEFSPSH